MTILPAATSDRYVTAHCLVPKIEGILLKTGRIELYRIERDGSLKQNLAYSLPRAKSLLEIYYMSRQEIPAEIWRQNLISKSAIHEPVIPLLGIGGFSFRLLPDEVFDTCTTLVRDAFLSTPNKRRAFEKMYEVNLAQADANRYNIQLIEATHTRDEIQNSQGLSLDQQQNFTKEIERLSIKLKDARDQSSRNSELLRVEFRENPEFQRDFMSFEERYKALVEMAVNDFTVLIFRGPFADQLEAIGAAQGIHELIGYNIGFLRNATTT